MSKSNLRGGESLDSVNYPEEIILDNVTQSEDQDKMKKNHELLYNIAEIPPWFLCILLGVQHCMTIFAMSLLTPFFLIDEKCLGYAASFKGDIYCTTLLGLGLSTFLQVTFGSRLPLVQGIATEYTVSLLPLMEGCRNRNQSLNGFTFNSTAEEDTFIWKNEMRKLQGAVIIAGLLEFFIGMTGLVGLIRRCVTPLVLFPSIVLIGLMMIGPGGDLCAKHWGISIMTMFLAILFSQYLHNIKIPCLACWRRPHVKKIKIFQIFPIILALLISWIFCAILTACGIFPDSPHNSSYGYFARTDIRSHFISKADWARVSYPGQWGAPVFSLSVIVAIIPPLISSIIDSFGEYFGCANLCSIPPPPNHSINRGIAIEGIGGVICGLLGFGSNTTTVGTNLGLIGITRVASRRVIQVMSLILIIVSFSGKTGALFLTIPEPVIGGALCVGIAMLIGAAFTNLKNVDVFCKRNIFILGFSIFMGMMIPNWYKANYKTAQSGNKILDDILKGLITSPMFVGGFIALLLENTIPGKVKSLYNESNESGTLPSDGLQHYNLPYASKLNTCKIFKLFPICPLFKFHRPCRGKNNSSASISNSPVLLQKTKHTNGYIP